MLCLCGMFSRRYNEYCVRIKFDLHHYDLLPSSPSLFLSLPFSQFLCYFWLNISSLYLLFNSSCISRSLFHVSFHFWSFVLIFGEEKTKIQREREINKRRIWIKWEEIEKERRGGKGGKRNCLHQTNKRQARTWHNLQFTLDVSGPCRPRMMNDAQQKRSKKKGNTRKLKWTQGE